MGQSSHSDNLPGVSPFHRLHLLVNFHIGADPERLISAGRLVSALFAALAIYLDPTRPARSLNEAHLVLSAYVVFSLLLMLCPPRRPLAHPVHLLSHAVDVLALGTLVYLTDELDSPFFPFVPFILLATTMRWGMRGAVLGAIVMEGMMIAVGWRDLTDGDSELNLVIMRSAYFLVAAAMLGYFGAYRARSGQRFAQLASWSAAPVSMDERAWLHDLLDHASRLLGAPRLILTWQDRGDPVGRAALFGPEGLALLPLPDGTGRAGIAAILQSAGWAMPAPREMRSAPFVGTRNKGRLHVLDIRHGHEDDASLARITAQRIGDELERFALTHAIAESARDQERVRLARDLHDSVLQDLTAATLKLKAVAAGLPPAARGTLQAVSALMAAQQRRIRLFVEDGRKLAALRPLSASLSQNVNELCDQWGCDIGLTVTPPDMEATARVHRELAQLLSEATANAVRHGGATRLNVELSRIDHGLSLCIADNGCGMIVGESDDPPRPRSLRTRVEDMDGSLAITRYAPGLALRIEMPLPEMSEPGMPAS
ncbi:sensor histidine kinase [Sphingobium chungbukense]|uniref:sensor histidine kinase n=1 Tax=Sphingobium chungbukense TaxID=56193 RepID=UPI00069BDB49|nr:histidine kinase [Sphingobium chungbukense]